METGIPRPGLHDRRYAFTRLLPLALYRLYPCYRDALFGELAEGAIRGLKENVLTFSFSRQHVIGMFIEVSYRNIWFEHDFYCSIKFLSKPPTIHEFSKSYITTLPSPFAS